MFRGAARNQAILVPTENHNGRAPPVSEMTLDTTSQEETKCLMALRYGEREWEGREKIHLYKHDHDKESSSPRSKHPTAIDNTTHMLMCAPTQGTAHLITDVCTDTSTTKGEEKESKMERRERRRREKQERKLRRRKDEHEKIIAYTQNFNGSLSEDKREEVSRQMRRQKIGIVFGQEGRRPKATIERWDTGELLIAFGDCKKNNANGMKKDGNFFVLDDKWKQAFIRGGKQKKRYSPRLVSIRLPLRQGKYLHLLNAHFPDQGQKRATITAFRELFQTAMGEMKQEDVNIVGGDFNSSMGVGQEQEDGVCGPHGITHQDEAGRYLTATAAMYNMVDLVTWEV